jgi:hypothetical protein
MWYLNMLFTHKIEPFGKQQNEDINCMATMRIVMQAKNERQRYTFSYNSKHLYKWTKRIEGAALKINPQKRR